MRHLDRLAVVIAPRQRRNLHARCFGGVHIVARIADHEGICHCHAKMLQAVLQRLGMRFLVRQLIAAQQQVEKFP